MLKVEVDNPYRDFDYSGYQKTECNNCFIMEVVFASLLRASNTKRENLT